MRKDSVYTIRGCSWELADGLNPELPTTCPVLVASVPSQMGNLQPRARQIETLGNGPGEIQSLRHHPLAEGLREAEGYTVLQHDDKAMIGSAPAPKARQVNLCRPSSRGSRPRLPVRSDTRGMASAVADLLGGEAVLGPSADSNLGLARATRRGLPIGAAIHLVNQLTGSLEPELKSEVDSLIEHWRKGWELIGAGVAQEGRGAPAGMMLTPSHSDTLIRIASALVQAPEVLGERGKAVHWLRSPNRALGGETPISLLDTSAGEHEVEDLLGRIEHGVYS